MITKILLGIISVLLASIIWLTSVTLPNKEKEIAWIEAKADSIQSLPPEVEYIKGDSIPYPVYDTLRIEVKADPPVAENDSLYTSAYNDGFIKGTISATLYNRKVKSLRFNYQLITPISSYFRVDTLRIKEYYPMVINRADYTASKKDWIILAGLDFSYKDKVLFAPGVDFISRSRKSIGYSYDIANDIHWVKTRLPLVNKQ